MEYFNVGPDQTCETIGSWFNDIEHDDKFKKNILKRQVNKCKKLNIIEQTPVKTVQLDCNITITKPTGALAGFRLNHMVKSEFCNISYKKATIPVPVTIKFIYNFQG